jgi:transcriptional regulator with XRE-family HTH domain
MGRAAARPLGVAIGLDETTGSARISRYETGVHEPPIATAKLLAAELGVPLAFLYCDDDDLAAALLNLAGHGHLARPITTCIEFWCSSASRPSPWFLGGPVIKPPAGRGGATGRARAQDLSWRAKGYASIAARRCWASGCTGGNLGRPLSCQRQGALSPLSWPQVPCKWAHTPPAACPTGAES